MRGTTVPLLIIPMRKVNKIQGELLKYLTYLLCQVESLFGQFVVSYAVMSYHLLCSEQKTLISMPSKNTNTREVVGNISFRRTEGKYFLIYRTENWQLIRKIVDKLFCQFSQADFCPLSNVSKSHEGHSSWFQLLWPSLKYNSSYTITKTMIILINLQKIIINHWLPVPLAVINAAYEQQNVNCQKCNFLSCFSQRVDCLPIMSYLRCLAQYVGL